MTNSSKTRSVNKIDKLIDERSRGNGWFVHLKPGWAVNDADTENAQHDFGEDTRAAAYNTARGANPCSCATCLEAKVKGGVL